MQPTPEIKPLFVVERETVIAAVRKFGTMKPAAKALAISVRTLQRKLKAYRTLGHLPPDFKISSK